jgi:hypothetical protein
MKLPQQFWEQQDFVYVNNTQTNLYLGIKIFVGWICLGELAL